MTVLEASPMLPTPTPTPIPHAINEPLLIDNPTRIPPVTKKKQAAIQFPRSYYSASTVYIPNVHL